MLFELGGLKKPTTEL